MASGTLRAAAAAAYPVGRSLISRAMAADVLGSSSRDAVRAALVRPPYDVFINHRGVDTKRTVATLLYERLVQHNVRAFLDSMSMKPGDRLFERIDEAIHGCRLAVTIFSPRYCDSEFCLHELATLVEARKKIIPVFIDIKPSQLQLPQTIAITSSSTSPRLTQADINRFRMALHEAKCTVGLTFDTNTGNFADLLSATTKIVLENICAEESIVKSSTCGLINY